MKNVSFSVDCCELRAEIEEHYERFEVAEHWFKRCLEAAIAGIEKGARRTMYAFSSLEGFYTRRNNAGPAEVAREAYRSELPWLLKDTAGE